MQQLKSLFLVEEGEGKKVLFYLTLFLCLGAGMAIGRGSADALFLKRYGIEYLPVMYLILSLVLAVSFFAYAAFVDRLPPERFFITLLVLQIILLVLFWYAIVYLQNDSIYPAYFLLYELVSELILVHATFYIGQNLDTLQSKRLTSLIFSGYQLGMILGGSFLATVISKTGVENALLVWSGLAFVSLSLLIYWHQRTGVSPFFHPPAKKRSNHMRAAVNEVRHGVNFIKQSNLLKNSSFALFFLVITFYVMSFSVNKIYTESFSSEEQLTAFFGALVAVTNLSALLLQVLVSSRFIERFGVSKTKLVFPVTVLLGFVLLLFSPGFYAALISSFSKDAIMPAFRNPARQMFFNVLPDYMKGRARATQVALVLPVALFICGALIWYLQYVENFLLITVLGLICASYYLFYCYRMGKSYVSALIENLKGRLYLPEDTFVGNFTGGSDEVYKALKNGLSSKDIKARMSYANLMLKAFHERGVDTLLEHVKNESAEVADQLVHLVGEEANDEQINRLLETLDHGDNHLKATIYHVVFYKSRTDRSALMEKALEEKSPRIKAAGVAGILEKKVTHLREHAHQVWSELVHGDNESQLAAIELIEYVNTANIVDKKSFIQKYSELCSNVIIHSGQKQRIVAYEFLKQWQWGLSAVAYETMRNDLESIDPELRSAAACCVFLLPSKHDRKAYLWKMLGDGHASVRKAALKVFMAVYPEPINTCFDWVVKNTPGTSRAQQILVKAMIRRDVSQNKLQKIVDAKIRYASVILGALHVLSNEETETAIQVVTRKALEEKLMQTVDLALLALEPTMEKGVISVIRAGISSKDTRQTANAREALQSLESKQVFTLLSNLIGRDYMRASKRGHMQIFSNAAEVFSWCARGSDEWLSECGVEALREVSV